MNNLDDMDLYARLDPGGMGSLIGGFADQCRAAWKNVATMELPNKYRDARQVLILGMGGSAIGGDLLRTLVAGECPVPIIVSREYGAPVWAGPDTLAIAVSHSGNTEETLSALEHARTRGGMLLGITTGGELGRQNGMPIVRYDFASQPRAALAYSFLSLVGVLSQLGLLANPGLTLERALRDLDALEREIGPRAPSDKNKAKQLASKLFGHIPVIYGAGVLEEVAHRWKTQMNENAKTTAFYDLMSELDHNAVVGYEFPPTGLKSLVFVSLLSRQADVRIQKRFEVTGQLLRRKGLAHEAVEVKGESGLGEMLYAIHLGDYVSYYLALLNGVDPTPVTAIDFLKNALKS